MVETKVKRGSVSWAYIYVALAFAISIEGQIISMIEPLPWLWKIIAYALLVVVTCWIFLWFDWVPNKLIRLKNWYENRYR